MSLTLGKNGNRDAEAIHRTDTNSSFTYANVIDGEPDETKRFVPEEVNTSSPATSKRKRVISLVIAVTLAASAISGLLSWLHASQHESTDDAFIEGHVIQISPKVAGNVLKVHIDDNQEVKQGDLLVEIDPRDFEVRLAQACTALEAGMVKQQTVSLTEITSGAAVQQASAQVEAARQNLESARAQLLAAEAQDIQDRDDEKRNQELYRREQYWCAPAEINRRFRPLSLSLT